MLWQRHRRGHLNMRAATALQQPLISSARGGGQTNVISDNNINETR